MRNILSKNDKNWQGPWGAPPSGGGSGGGMGGGGSSGGGRNQPPPDLDELLRKSQEKFRGMFPPENGQDKRVFSLIAAAALMLWAASGIYMVKTDELGVVVRFGKFDRTTPPGIHYHLPYPIEVVKTPQVTSVNRVEVGFNSGFGGGQDRSVPEEALMLTGDENIVDIHFEVQWKIGKADDFLFNLRDPEPTVKAVAESAMREVVGQVEIMSVISEGNGRSQAEQQTKAMMQSMLDSYHSGIEIVAVNMLKADPPSEVIEAFRDVQSARADQETERNKAEAYRNDILPRARGQAEQMIQEAEAYKQEVVARASGEASRFAAVFEEYKSSPAVVRNRMYLETMENIYQGMNKVIVDDKAGNVLPFLPLQELKSPKPKGENQ
jgi:membrane protease subunit HflK